MRDEDIWNNKAEYYKWMMGMIDLHGDVDNYACLLQHLNDIPFTYLMDDDYNRYIDGKSIRYEFAWRYFIPYAEIDECFGGDEPTVLEVMLALAFKLATSFMSGSEDTATIFWIMINHLGLIEMVNNNYDYYYVDMIIGKFLNRQYCTDGQGSLFVIFGDEDATKLTIWQQACRYIDCQA